jgi:hypothetical protein
MSSGVRDDRTSRADAFRWGALGKCALRVLHAVERLGAPNVAALSEALSMSPRQVRRHVGHLVEARVLVRDADKLRRSDADLMHVAAEKGTLGVGALQRARHRAERLAYQQARCERRRLIIQILTAAVQHRWPAVGPVIDGGEDQWRRFVKTSSTKGLRTALRALMAFPIRSSSSAEAT